MMGRILSQAVAYLLLGAGITLSLAACNGAQPTVTPTQTGTPAATSTPTPTPTATPTGPMSTATPPPGYGGSCARDVPWGYQVSKQFVCIDAPEAGTVVQRGSLVDVRGYAGGSFESNVVIELRTLQNGQPAATPMEMTPLTYAAPDIGMPGGWEVNLPIAADAPTGPARVTAYFESPQDGSRVAEASVDIVIQ